MNGSASPDTNVPLAPAVMLADCTAEAPADNPLADGPYPDSSTRDSVLLPSAGPSPRRSPMKTASGACSA